MEQEFTGEFEMNLKERRSSILKKEKPKNADEDETEALPRLSRRVSFASSNFIKPFAADPEDNTIWDSTYEEQINHTDSKSASERSQDTSPDVFNMSVWDNHNYPLVASTDRMPNKDKIPLRKPFTAITPEDLVVNKENIFFQQGLISFKEKSSTFMDITGTQIEIFNEGHTLPKTRQNTAEGEMEMTMTSTVQPHLTGILKKNTWNQPSCIKNTQTSESGSNQGNRGRFCEVRDSMDFSAYVKRVLRGNGNETMEITENLSKYCLQRNDKIKSDQSTIMYEPFEGNMEITSTLPSPTLIKGYEDMEITSMVPISNTVISENNIGQSSLFEFAKKIYGQTVKYSKEEIAESDDMEVTSVVPVHNFNMTQEPMEITKGRLSRSQVIEEDGVNNTKSFARSVGDMELTTIIQTQEKLVNEMVLPSQSEKCTFPKDKTLMEITYNLTSTENRQENFDRDKGKVRSTTLSFKEKSGYFTKEKSDTSANATIFKIHNKEESVMELTSVLPSVEQLRNHSNIPDKNISNDTNSLRKSQVFLPPEGDMELTSGVPSAEQLKNHSNLPDKNISNNTNSLRKTQVFLPSEGDMELTSGLPSAEQLKDSSNLPDNNISNDTNSLRKTQVFLPSEGDMELTSGLPSAEQLKNHSNLPDKNISNNINSLKKTQVFLPSEGNMELTSGLPSAEQLKDSSNLPDNNISNDTNSLRKTQVFLPSEGDMELTSGLPSAEHLKYHSNLPVKNISKNRNSVLKAQVFLPSEGDMELTSRVPSAEQLKNPSNLPAKNISNNTNSLRKTQVFLPSEGDMELTSGLPSAEQLKNPSNLPDQNISNNTNSLRKTQVFLPSEGDKELTSGLPSAEQLKDSSNLPDNNISNNTNSLRKTQVFLPSEGDMELTSGLPSAEQLKNHSNLPDKNISNNINSLKKTQVFLPSEGDMELTSGLPSAEQLKNYSNLPDKNISHDTNSLRKTQVFLPSEGDMELTSGLPSAEQLKNHSNLPAKNISNVSNSLRKTQVFLPSEGDMELTSGLPSAEQLKNHSNLPDKNISNDTNSRRKAQVLPSSVGEMELTSVLPYEEQLKDPPYLPEKNMSIDTNPRRKTHIFRQSEGDMELTSGLPSAENLKNPSYLPDKNVCDDTNSRQKTHVFQPSEGDMELTSVLPSAEQLKNHSYLPDKNISNDTNSLRKTQIFLPSEGDMEITSSLRSAEQLKNPSYLPFENMPDNRNSRRKTHIFQPSEGEMELSSDLPPAEQLKDPRFLSDKNVSNYINCSIKTHVLQSSEEDMEFSHVLPSAEQLKNVSCIPNKNRSHVNNFIQKTDSEGDMVFPTLLSTAKQLSNLSHGASASANSKVHSKRDCEISNVLTSGSQKMFEIEESSRLPSETTHIISCLTNSEEQRKNMEATSSCDSSNNRGVTIDEKTFQMDMEFSSAIPQHFEEEMPIRKKQKGETGIIPSDIIDLTSELAVQNKENVKPAMKTRSSEPSEANMECVNVSQTVDINEVLEHSLRFNTSKQFSALNQFPSDNNVDIQRNISSDNKQDLDTVAENSQRNIQPNNSNNFLANSSEAQEEEKTVTNFITYRRSKHVPFLGSNESSAYLSQGLNVDNLDKSKTEPLKETSKINIFKVKNIDEEIVDKPQKKIVSCKNFKIGPNILFSAKIDSRISEADQISATPPSSFYRHYHNPNEDTQVLINATTSHPESFKLELSQRLNQVNEENIDDDSFVNRACNLRDTSYTHTNDCSTKVPSDKTIVDTTPIDLVDLSNPMEFEESGENEILNKSEDNQPTNIVNRIRNSDYRNYTIRSNTLLQNITEYLISPSEDEIAREKEQEERIQKLHQDVRDKCYTIKELLNNYRLPQVDLVLLEDKLKAESEDSRSSNSSTNNNFIMEHLTNRDSIENLPPPKTVYERVYEAAERSKTCWELAKAENDYYYFYTLYGTVPFKVHTHPELGIVYSVETYYNISDASKPLGFYLAEIVHQKLKKENLLASLGPKYDILTLLDYVSMTLQEIYDFEKELSILCTKYRNFQITMDKEFRLSFKFLSVKHTIWWNIFVKFSPNNIGCPVDISAVEQIGEKVNEDHIKKIAQNTPTGIHFLTNFIEGIEEYVQRMGRKLKFK